MRTIPTALSPPLGGATSPSRPAGQYIVTKCSPVEVVPRTHPNCTEEIPVTFNGTDAFVDPISYVLKSAGSPIHCNDVAPQAPQVQGRREVVLQLPGAEGVP